MPARWQYCASRPSIHEAKMPSISTFLILAGTAKAATPLYSTYEFNPLQHLSGVAPYFEPADPPRDPNPPEGCTVTRAAYLVRHAAINANDFDSEEYIDPFLEKLGNKSVDWSKSPALSFLSDWIPPTIVEEEQLTRTGKLEAAQLGLTVSYRYPGLRLPERVWASTAERTVKSAQSFIRGLEVEDDTINLVEIYEGEEDGANSLTTYESCPKYKSSTGSDQEAEYLDKYTAPIIARFNANASSFNFTSDDIFAMQSICGYETVIRGSSPFCSTEIFSPDEWLSFEYANDIFYHYNTGYGNDNSGVIGFPWLNASLGLLAADQADQDIYVSFTHRELPPTVLVAMGLFNNSQFSGANNVNATMPLDQINYNRAWVSSYILPFLTNIAIERMNCSGPEFQDSDDSTYYRVMVNASPQTLPGCSDGPLESCSESGLQDYLSERAAMFGGFTERCNATYSNSTDTVSFYTNSNNGTSVG
jgi:acid phosphatase